MKLSGLSPNPKNPRKISDKKLEMLKASMLEFGSLDGVLYNRRTKRLFGGHQRQKSFPDSALTIEQRFRKPTAVGTTAVGYVTIEGERYPYREVDWDAKREMAANIAANKGAGEWDLPQLSEWLLELDHANFNLDLTMFDADERENVVVPVQHVPPEGDPDHVPTPPVDPTTKLGDIWKLGDHRLMCGDSTSSSAVDRLMTGGKADMVFTDPPYIGMVGADWDKKDLDWPAIFANLLGATAKNSNIVVTGQTPVIFKWFPILSEMFDFVQDMVWVKQRAVNLSQTTFARRHENVLWFKRGDKYFDSNGSRTDTHLKRLNKWSDSKIFKGSKGGLAGGEEIVNGYSAQSVFEFGRVYHHHEEYQGHPTQKPTELIAYILVSLSQVRAGVLDLFGGSGSTLIACEKVNRKCFMMELDPRYCDVIVKRWETYTGKKASLVSSHKAANG